MSLKVQGEDRSVGDSRLAEIENSFRQRDPSLFFVLPRIVRRVIRQELEINSPWVRVPHRKSFVINRERLLWTVATDELGVDSPASIPDRAILIARPEEEQQTRQTPEQLGRYLWRLVYHARLDAVLWERTSTRQMSPAQLRQRIDRLGQEQFDEVRAVLRQEGYLTHPENPRNVYSEFAVLFSELRAFDPEMLPLYFPSLDDVARIDALIREDCDPQRLLDATRPEEFLHRSIPATATLAPSPELLQEASSLIEAPRELAPSRWRYRWAVRRAEKLSQRGNAVRSMVQRCYADRVAPPVQREDNQQRLAAELEQFSRRLQSALELDEAEANRWVEMCQLLLVHAATGFWNANARLLYDLQKVCIDHERDVYRVDLAAWVWSRGKIPLRRPLPDLKLVLISKHLRSAVRRINSVVLARDAREKLTELLNHAAQRAEDLLRRMLDPQVVMALYEAGVVPTNIVEQTAFQKLASELIDGVVERGYLTLGQVRDSVSRGQFKLPDLTTPMEFVRGDRLLQADRRLAVILDGVYQRGPFYLRWLQRATSLFFGTPVGRLFTRFVALPFGGAYVILKGLQLLNDELAELLHIPVAHVFSTPATLGLGLLLLGLINWPLFAQGAWVVMKSAWMLIRGLLIDVPRFLYHIPGVAWLLKSPPVQMFRRYFLSPLFVTLLLWKALPALGAYREFHLGWAALLLAVSSALLNSRVGRDSEELLLEWSGRAWHRFRVTIVIGLFNLIIDLFRQIMDAIERVLYGVDEWLRFRTGESHLSLGIKAVLGLIWGVVHGVIRFCITLLIEPQINPIKHFPVVTVSHKLIFPLAFHLAKLFETFTDRITAGAIGTTIVTCIPGVFGFLAWEFKENWRLYAANRSDTLRPVSVGHHGETVLRLLKPGFHSGTIPKLFARRRRAARKSRYSSDERRQLQFDARLHHEAEALQHFIEREFIELLRQSRRLHEWPLTICHVELSTNRLKFSIELAGDPEPLKISLAEQSGWLVAGVLTPGWTQRLDHDQLVVVSTALAGLYHLAAVDLVREQMERHLGSPHHPYDISEGSLIVWPTRSYDTEVVYTLDERPTLHPRPRSAARLAQLSPIPTKSLIFRQRPISWSDWLSFWEQERTGEVCPSALLPDVPVLSVNRVGK